MQWILLRQWKQQCKNWWIFLVKASARSVGETLGKAVDFKWGGKKMLVPAALPSPLSMEWFLSTYKLASVSPIFKKSFTRSFILLSCQTISLPFFSEKKISKVLLTLCLQFFISLKPTLYLRDEFGIKYRKLWVNCKIKWGFMNLNNKNPTGREGSRLCFVAILLALPSSLMLALSWGWYQHGCHRTRCLSRNDNSQWKKRNCLLALLFEEKRTLWKSFNRRPLTSLCPELYHVPVPNWIIARGK